MFWLFTALHFTIKQLRLGHIVWHRQGRVSEPHLSRTNKGQHSNCQHYNCQHSNCQHYNCNTPTVWKPNKIQDLLQRLDKFTGQTTWSPCLWARVYSVVVDGHGRVGASVRCPAGRPPRCPATPSPGSGCSEGWTVEWDTSANKAWYHYTLGNLGIIWVKWWGGSNGITYRAVLRVQRQFGV